MDSSKQALAYFGGECANDDDYAFTPSGVRTKVALKLPAEDAAAAPKDTPAQRALDELAAADSIREEEEPTTEWVTPAPAVSAWDDAQLDALLQLETQGVADPVIELSSEVIELDPQDLVDEPDLPETLWMIPEGQPTPVPAEDYVSAWSDPLEPAMARSSSDWTTTTWLTVGAAVFGGEALALMLAFM